MSVPRIEFEMRLPVSRWLLSRGLSPVCEVGCLHNCDLVGVRFEEKPVRLVEMVAVELKLTRVAEVLGQCRNHYLQPMSETWAAMLPEVAERNAAKFSAVGVGLLAVHGGDDVRIVVEPKRFEGCDFTPWKNAMRRRRAEHVWRMQRQNMLKYGAEVA